MKKYEKIKNIRKEFKGTSWHHEKTKYMNYGHRRRKIQGHGIEKIFNSIIEKNPPQIKEDIATDRRSIQTTKSDQKRNFPHLIVNILTIQNK